jgi:NAD-dependent deacetylase
VRLEEVATPEALGRDPARVLAFYDARRRQLQHPQSPPTPRHEALARLEAVRLGEVMIATQNIDDLHERAGSYAVVHMHGKLLKARCTACGKTTVWCNDLTGNEGRRSARSRASSGHMSFGSARCHWASTRFYQVLAQCKVPALSKKRAAPAPPRSG